MTKKIIVSNLCTISKLYFRLLLGETLLFRCHKQVERTATRSNRKVGVGLDGAGIVQEVVDDESHRSHAHHGLFGRKLVISFHFRFYRPKIARSHFLNLANENCTYSCFLGRYYKFTITDYIKMRCDQRDVK